MVLLCSLAVLIYSGADPLPDASFRRSGAQKFGSGTPCIVSRLCYTVRLIETAVNHKSLRIFWALCPPEAVASSISQLIGALQRELKHPAEALGLRAMFTKPAHLHVTVKFLGSVPEETVGDLLELVRTRLQESPQLVAPMLQLRGLTVFPEPQHPQVLVANVLNADGGPATELIELHTQLTKWLAPVIVVPEAHPYHPHLTVSRLRRQENEHGRATAASSAMNPAAVAGLQALLAKQHDQTYGPTFTADSLVLFESQPSSSGPRYTPLAKLQLPKRQGCTHEPTTSG